jgi:CDGSH-type Zn-finger protein
MPRLVKHNANHPFVIKLGDIPGFDKVSNDEKVKNYQIHVCACGLSRHKPFCDGSHRRVADEDSAKVYGYDIEGGRRELEDDSGLQNEY